MSRLTLDLAEIGALVGDPARANILAALMDGRALTAIHPRQLCDGTGDSRAVGYQKIFHWAAGGDTGYVGHGEAFDRRAQIVQGVLGS